MLVKGVNLCIQVNATGHGMSWTVSRQEHWLQVGGWEVFTVPRAKLSDILILHQGHIYISDKTVYIKISESVMKLVVWIITLFWNVTGVSAAELPRHLSKLPALRLCKILWWDALRNIETAPGKIQYSNFALYPGGCLNKKDGLT